MKIVHLYAPEDLRYQSDVSAFGDGERLIR